ncbi:MAG: translation initiation factor IF-2 [Bacteroidales bacterium]|nr:translation initiation factor IF-2 [Bacteroidales bacterium]MCF8455358.1 translation initiation factor IF-2 [Bacteroidales bacterium]
MATGGKGTRLNRIARDLNVGIVTIVEFLHKKGLDIDADPNSKVPAEYYDLLVKEYSSDSEIKKESEKLMRSIRMRKQTLTLESQEAEEEYEEEEVEETPVEEPKKAPIAAAPQKETITKKPVVEKVEQPEPKAEESKKTIQTPAIVEEKPASTEETKETVKAQVVEESMHVEKVDALIAKKKSKPSTKETVKEDSAPDDTKKPKTVDETISSEAISGAIIKEEEKPIQVVKPAEEAISETVIQEIKVPDPVEKEKVEKPASPIAETEISTTGEAVPETTIPEAKEKVTPEQESLPEPKEETELVEEEVAEGEFDVDDEDIVVDEESLPGEFKVVGKIDLSTINQKTRPSKKSRKEKEKERVEKERAKKDAQSEWRKKIQKIHSPEPAVGAKKEHDKKKLVKRPVEKYEPETGNVIKTEFKKLSGPTVVGKIELPAKEKKKAKIKPVASSTDNESQISKKRRKRIRKDRVDIDKKDAPAASDKKFPLSKAKPKKKPLRTEVSEEDVQKQIKDTLARLTSKGKSKGAKHRRTKRDDVRARHLEDMEKEELEKNILKVSEFVSVNELATMMDIPVNKVIAACMSLGLFVSINQRLDAETMTLVAEEFGYEVQFTTVDLEENFVEEDNEEDLIPRPPIVTVMGHVDHGKTSLLDYIRKANVIAGEAGGITQHIGAYTVELSSGKNITFLDTPGHEAFTAMRARGAKVTDFAIVVVAADDNVMPQTVEAINHASAAGVPIIFAINKVDKPGANPEKIKESLASMNYLVEDWGGKYQSQEISAKFGTNVDDLLEKVLLEAEMLDLKGNPNKAAHGTIIESSLDKGRGYVATILVQSGTLKVGDIILAGSYTGNVKAMFNERGNKILTAGPSVPALVLGLNGAPQAGDTFHVMSSERDAREIANKREQLMREQSLRTQKHITLDEIGRRLALGDFHEINIIVKGDVDGSIEALSDSLIKLSTDSVQVNIKHKAVGQISESDIMLAMASNAIVVGFQVRPSLSARKLAEKEEIDIRLYSIIYDAINEMRDAMEGMLSPELKEEIVATLEVREVFKITKVGTIAGCIVKEGKINRNTRIRLIREGIVVYTGELGSLKRFKDDVKEVTIGYECGLNITNFNDIKEGDIIEGFTEVEVKKKL